MLIQLTSVGLQIGYAFEHLCVNDGVGLVFRDLRLGFWSSKCGPAWLGVPFVRLDPRADSKTGSQNSRSNDARTPRYVLEVFGQLPSFRSLDILVSRFP